MKRAAIVATLLAFAVLPSRAQENAPLLRLVAPDLPKNSRLMGFSFDIIAGRVASLRDVPPGWHVTIDNDPSWHTKISANAIVGAAALETSDIARLFLIQEVPTRDKLNPSDVVSVSGRIDVMTDGDVRSLAEPLIHLGKP